MCDINKIKEYYDQEASDYIKQYESGFDKYPSNLTRINVIIERLKENNIKSILSVGCGVAGPMIKLLENGFVVKGFDFSEKMIETGKQELKKKNFDENLIWVADIEKDVPVDKFDAALALGVFPHIKDEKNALKNIAKTLNKNGKVFIEFRNKFFSAFTFNRYSLDFFAQEVIDINKFDENIKNDIYSYLCKIFDLEQNIARTDNKIKYSDIYAKFHNPLSISQDLFEHCGFLVNKIFFYHYHALPPIFEKKYPLLFKEHSLKLENPYDWRGYLMASAFVVEAQLNE